MENLKKYEIILGWIGVLFVLPIIIYGYGLMLLSNEIISMEFATVSGGIGLLLIIFFWRKNFLPKRKKK